MVLHAAAATSGLAVLGMTFGLRPAAPELLVALLAIAVVCELSETWLASGIRFNATLAVAVMALALSGPIAAFAVLLLPDVAVWALRRDERLWRTGTLANVGAYAWAAIAGAGVLAVADVHGPALAGMPALVSAGLALAAVNFAVGPAIYAPLQLGVPARHMPGELAAALPAVLVMAAGAAATTALTVPLGVFALGGFAFVTLVPASALTLLARARPVAELDVIGATALFAAAIADVQRLDRAARRRLQRAAALMGQCPDPHDRLLRSLPAPGRTHEDFEIALVAAHADERWNGSGAPAGVCGTVIPPLSRVLTVAHAWARLTAQGTAELSHTEALLDLHAQTGSAFDPATVAAAAHVVERDARLAPVPTAQPRIHAWPGSRALRAWAAPRLLALAHAAR